MTDLSSSDAESVVSEYETNNSLTDESDLNDNEEHTECFRQQLGDLPLGELQKLKETVGLKKYSEALFGSWKPQLTHTDDPNDKKNFEKVVPEQRGKNRLKKTDKSKPEEKSSKFKVNKPRQIANKISRVKRDPRFDDLSGKLNEDLFKKSYTFIDDMKSKEMNIIRKQIKKTKDKEQKIHLHKLLDRMKQQNEMQISSKKQMDLDRKRKNEEIDLVKKGKKAFYLKKSDKRKLELAEKYRQLKSSGQLDKYMGKKWKRNASKEKRKLPISDKH